MTIKGLSKEEANESFERVSEELARLAIEQYALSEHIRALEGETESWVGDVEFESMSAAHDVISVMMEEERERYAEKQRRAELHRQMHAMDMPDTHGWM